MSTPIIDPWARSVSFIAQDFSLVFYPIAENCPLLTQGSKSMIIMHLCCPERLISLFTFSKGSKYSNLVWDHFPKCTKWMFVNS